MLLTYEDFKQTVLEEALSSDTFNSVMLDRNKPMTKAQMDAKCKALGICDDDKPTRTVKPTKPKFKKGDAVIFSGKTVKQPKLLYVNDLDWNDDLNRWDYYLALKPKAKEAGYVGTESVMELSK
jgi:hypothetical protein